MSPRRPQTKEAETQRIEQILDGAARVFAEKGFHNATTKDIARAAEVAEGTLYNYFGTKRGLLIALLQRLGDMSPLDEIQHDELHNAKTYYIADARAQMNNFWQSRETLKAVIPEILIDAELRALFLAGLSHQYLRYVEPYLASRIAHGEIVPIDNIPLTARLMQSIPLGLLLLVLLGDPVIEAEWEKLPGLMAHLVYDGLKHMPEEGG